MDRFDFRIGARVHLQNGPGGSLQKVVVDPCTRRVTDLVIERGFLQKKSRVIPVTLVETVTAERITLALYSQQLRHYPEYYEEAFAESVDGWDPLFHYPCDQVFHWLPDYGLYENQEMCLPMLQRRVYKGIRSNHEVIGRSTPVRNRRGVVGKVDHLLANRHTRDIEYLVVRKSFVPYRLIIPASWIEEVNVNGVFIRGEVRSMATREAAEDVAAMQPGAFSVVNALRVQARQTKPGPDIDDAVSLER